MPPSPWDVLGGFAEGAGSFLTSVGEVLEGRRSRKPAPGPPEPPKNVNRAGYEWAVPDQGLSEYNTTTVGELDRRTLLAELHDVYVTCPWSWASVNAIARRITSGDLEFVYDPATPVEGDEKQPDKPAEVVACERLFAFCNERENIRQLLRRAIMNLLVFADAYIEMVWVGKTPVALYSQDVPTTGPITDNHGRILSWVQVTDYGQRAEFEPRQIVSISLDGARSGVFGISPTQAAKVAIETWLHAAANRLHNYRRGDPLQLHVDLPTHMSAPDQRKWVAQFMTRNVGPANIGYPITTSGGGQVKTLGERKIADLVSVMNAARDEIVSSYGVPPAKAGIIESGNLGGGTGEAQDKDFDVTTCDPIAALLLEALQYHVAYKGFGIVDWKLRFAEVDTRDSKTIEDIRRMRLEVGAYTLNEYRAEIGKPPVDGGDQALVLTVPAGNITRVRDIEAATLAGIAKQLAGSGWEIDASGDEDDPITLKRAPAQHPAPGGPAALPPGQTTVAGADDGEPADADDKWDWDDTEESTPEDGDIEEGRHVRTAGGARRYGVPIGSPIPPGAGRRTSGPGKRRSGKKPAPAGTKAAAGPSTKLPPASAHTAKLADGLLIDRDRSATVKGMSDTDLRDLDVEFSRRANLVGKPGQVSRTHAVIRGEIRDRDRDRDLEPATGPGRSDRPGDTRDGDTKAAPADDKNGGNGEDGAAPAKGDVPAKNEQPTAKSGDTPPNNDAPAKDAPGKGKPAKGGEQKKPAAPTKAGRKPSGDAGKPQPADQPAPARGGNQAPPPRLIAALVRLVARLFSSKGDRDGKPADPVKLRGQLNDPTSELRSNIRKLVDREHPDASYNDRVRAEQSLITSTAKIFGVPTEGDAGDPDAGGAVSEADTPDQIDTEQLAADWLAFVEHARPATP